MVQITKNNKVIPVQFFINCKTCYGQILYICGNCPQLGNWNPLSGLRLQTNRKTYPEWYSRYPIIVRPNQLIQFKICLVKDNLIIWESIPQNHYFFTRQKPGQVYLDFNSCHMQYLEKKIIQMQCRKGLQNILDDLESQWGSSIGHLSNYPLEKYHKKRKGKCYQQSSVSSNLISWEDIQQKQFEQKIFNQFYQTRLIKTRSNNHQFQIFKYLKNKFNNNQNQNLDLQNALKQIKYDEKINFRSLSKKKSQKMKQIIFKTDLQSMKSYPKIKIPQNIDKNDWNASNDSKSTYSSRKNQYQRKTVKISPLIDISFKFQNNEQSQCQDQQLFGFQFF